MLYVSDLPEKSCNFIKILALHIT